MAAACLDALDDEGKGLVRDAATRVQAVTPADVVVLDGAPVDTITDYAHSSGADLVIIGSHGRTGLSRLFLGSVAEGVIRNASAPVMVVRQAVVAKPAAVKSEAATQATATV